MSASSSLVLGVAGIWLLTQIFGGNMLTRLGVVK